MFGFDSFDGLPEKWSTSNKVSYDTGYFSTDGICPSTVSPLADIKVGLYKDTIPKFLEKNKKQCAFIHIDCDLYQSTKDILTLLKDYIVDGTIIMFDELIGYPNFKEHEFRKAFDVIIVNCSQA